MLKFFKSPSSALIKIKGFSYVTSVFDSHDLKKICKMLNQPFYKFNEDVEHLPQIKLIDSNGKTIGTYDTKEAKKKAHKMKCDIVLINEAVNPPICKAFNYKDHLYKLFIKEFAEETKRTSLEKKPSQIRTFYLSTRIAEHDLKNKIRTAVEASKNNTIIRVVVKIIPEIDEDDAINTLYTFRDYSGEHLTTIGDVNKGEVKVSDQDADYKYLTKGRDKLETVFLDFKNIRAKPEKETSQQAPKKLSDAEMKKMIDSFFYTRSKGKYAVDIPLEDRGKEIPTGKDQWGEKEDPKKQNERFFDEYDKTSSGKLSKKQIKILGGQMANYTKNANQSDSSGAKVKTSEDEPFEDEAEELAFKGKKSKQISSDMQNMIQMAHVQSVLTKRIMEIAKLNNKSLK